MGNEAVATMLILKGSNQATARLKMLSMSLSSLLRRSAAAVTVTAGAALVLGAGARSAENATTGGSGRTFTASLVGANEVPSGSGSLVGSGQASFTLDPAAARSAST